MKEHYLTKQFIQKMLENLKVFRDQHNFTLIPKHSALLVIDMQRYFAQKSSHAYIPSAISIIPKIKSLIKVYYKWELPVIFTRHLNTQENAKLMAKWWGDLIKEDDPLSKIIPGLDLSRGIIVKKTQYDAFYETELEEILRKKGVSQVVVCGVMTQLCCETTARSAFMRGFEVFFTIDGTAAYNKEFHTSTLLNLSYGFAVPVLVEEILLKIRNPNVGKVSRP